MKTRQRTKKDSRKATAYHEAGHAVAASCLGLKLKYVTIVPNEYSTGHVMPEPEDPSIADAVSRGDRWDCSRLRAEKWVMVLQAGEVAQMLFDSRSVRSSRFRTDRMMCLALLRAYAPDERRRDVEAHYRLLRVWTAHLISQHWPWVEAVENALLERDTMSGGQIDEVIRSIDGEQRRLEVQPLWDAVQAIRDLRTESGT